VKGVQSRHLNSAVSHRDDARIERGGRSVRPRAQICSAWTLLWCQGGNQPYRQNDRRGEVGPLAFVPDALSPSRSGHSRGEVCFAIATIAWTML